MGIFGSKSGTSGRASVLSLELKSWRQTERRSQVYALSLEVSLPGQTPFPAEVTTAVPYDRVPRVGQVLPVTVSAGNPPKVAVDWKAVPSLTDLARTSSAAALAGDDAGAAAALGFAARPQSEEAQGKGAGSAGPAAD